MAFIIAFLTAGSSTNKIFTAFQQLPISFLIRDHFSTSRTKGPLKTSPSRWASRFRRSTSPVPRTFSPVNGALNVFFDPRCARRNGGQLDECVYAVIIGSRRQKWFLISRRWERSRKKARKSCRAPMACSFAFVSLFMGRGSAGTTPVAVCVRRLKCNRVWKIAPNKSMMVSGIEVISSVERWFFTFRLIWAWALGVCYLFLKLFSFLKSGCWAAISYLEPLRNSFVRWNWFVQILLINNNWSLINNINNND